MREIPKVKKLGLLFALDMRNNPTKALTVAQAKYGDIFQKRIQGRQFYFLCHPEHAKYVLSKNQDNYRKSDIEINTFEPMFGAATIMMTNDQEQWQKDRELAKTAVESSLYFENYTQQIAEVCTGQFDDWEQKIRSSSPIEIPFQATKLFLEIVQHTLFTHIKFDTDTWARRSPELNSLIAKGLRTLIRFPSFIENRMKRSVQQKLGFYRNEISQLVNSRIKNETVYDDLLGTFIHNYKITDEQCPHVAHVTNAMLFFVFANFGSHSPLFQSVLVTLAQHPEMGQKIFDEVSAVCHGHAPTYADYDNLTYTQAYVNEVIRFYPNVDYILRSPNSDDTIQGYPISADSTVFLSVHLINRHKDYWVNPNEFNPDRFLSKTYEQDYPYTNIIFGGGRRGCVGKNFALLELCIVTAMIVQRFRFSFPENFVYKHQSGTAVLPGLDKMKVTLRRA